jgi:hypothetical protein
MKREKWKISSEESGVLRKEHKTRNKREEKPKVPTHSFTFFSTPYYLLLPPYFINRFTGLENAVGELVHTT